MNGSLALLVLACAQTPAADSKLAPFIARYDAAGLEFEVEPGANLRLGAVELRRGEQRIALHSTSAREDGAFTLFERAPGVLERFERTTAGVEHSFVVDGPLGGDGDLVVRVALGGANAELGARQSDGSHTFGGIAYGRLFGIDANGARTDGDVRLVHGGLELVIDDAWLDAAAWPITLDPVIAPALLVTSTAPVFTFSGEGEIDEAPDAAYDVTNAHYLHAFMRTTFTELVTPLGTSLSKKTTIRAQRLSSGGLTVGPLLQVDEIAVREPRVANIARRDRFAVSWFSNILSGFGDELNIRLVDADDSTLSGPLLIASTLDGEFVDHALAGESSLSTFFTSRAFAVWIDDVGDVKFARINVPASGDPTLTSTHTIAAQPGLFDSWLEVSIARCTNVEGRLVVALVRNSGLLGAQRVYAMTVDRDGTVVTPLTLVSGSDDRCSRVSVDGGGSNPSRWVIAWDEYDADTVPTYSLHAVALAGSGSALTAGTVRSHGTALTRFDPSVGWRPGMAVVAYNMPLSDDISVVMLCDTTAQVGEPASTAFDWPDTAATDYDTSDAVVALRSSGGDTNAHEGLLLCRRVAESLISTQYVIAARRYDAFDPAAVAQLQLQGCGGVGSIVVPSPPAIGNPDFSIDLVGAGPTASFAILNLTGVQPVQTCGSCNFAPLDILRFTPVVGGAASFALPLPCNPSLAGVELYAQWIVYKPGIAPCVPVPDFGATQIMSITVN